MDCATTGRKLTRHTVHTNNLEAPDHLYTCFSWTCDSTVRYQNAHNALKFILPRTQTVCTYLTFQGVVKSSGPCRF